MYRDDIVGVVSELRIPFRSLTNVLNIILYYITADDEGVYDIILCIPVRTVIEKYIMRRCYIMIILPCVCITQ